MTAERSLTPSTLGRLVGKSPTDKTQLVAMAARAHHENRGVAVIFLDRVRNQDRLKAIETELEVQYGKRNTTQKDVTA